MRISRVNILEGATARRVDAGRSTVNAIRVEYPALTFVNVETARIVHLTPIKEWVVPR